LRAEQKLEQHTDRQINAPLREEEGDDDDDDDEAGKVAMCRTDGET
jgi:hypothetical protein